MKKIILTGLFAAIFAMTVPATGQNYDGFVSGSDMGQIYNM